MKKEIKQMELRIGVVGHSLLQASLISAQEARMAKKGTGRSQQVKSPGTEDFDRSPRSPVNYEMF